MIHEVIDGGTSCGFPIRIVQESLDEPVIQKLVLESVIRHMAIMQ